MQKALFFLAIFGIVLFADEPSVYGLSGSAYSSKAMAAQQKRILKLEQKVRELQSQIEGLRSVVEGLSEASATRQSGGVSESRFNALQQKIDELSAMCSQKQQTVSTHTANPKSQKPKAVALADRPLRRLYTEGVRLFGKRRYDEAKKRFEITDAKGYKPAASNYYLGEIAYYTKHYDDAIFYYKKSAGLNENAGYIDILLLHAGIALEKQGDKAQAKRFFENIVANYPGKRSAKIAKQHLRRL